MPGLFRIASVLALVAPLMLAAQPRSATPSTAPQRLVIGDGTLARYRVTEKLAMNTFDNEVEGKTAAVTGMVVLDGGGRVIPAESRIVIDLTTLRTDKTRRDSYVQKNTLETARYPQAELRVTEIRGLGTTLPQSGSLALTVMGELTLHGATRPTTWTASAEFYPGGLKGTARTTVKFADFQITVPRVPVVARVDDPITLELDFHFVRETSAVVAPSR